MPAFILQYALMSFFTVAEKPALSLLVSIGAGIINGVLDYAFIDAFKWGVAGAALATGAGQIAGGIIPLIYFIYKKDLPINLVKTGFDFKIIKKAMVNGASEMVTNLATSVVSMVYNFQLMKMFGENGIAAYGIIMYESIIFMALNNGTVSAILSFLKTMVFEVASVIILPMMLGKNGIWLSVSLAELMALMLTAFL